jgi:hypothetical protein
MWMCGKGKREVKSGNFPCSHSSLIRFRQNWIIVFKLVNFLSSTVCLLLKGYVPFLYSFIGEEFTPRRGIPNRVDYFGLEIGPASFSMQFCREAGAFTCSMLQLLYSSFSHFLLVLPLSVRPSIRPSVRPSVCLYVCRVSQMFPRFTEPTTVQQNVKKTVLCFRKIRNAVSRQHKVFATGLAS